MADTKFWETKPLDALSDDEWESLCDGCGLCCLHKLEDADSGDIVYTAIACRLLDTTSCRCQRYAERRRAVPHCIEIRTATDRDYATLPPTCAYRLRWLNQPLPPWHPLVSGDATSVHGAGISVRDRVVSERDYDREIDVDAPLLS
ncbi:MAG: YcgN family cysteine cluster protein [Pseudomonadota bacterium]